jgi:hypothetical protein
VHDRCRTGVVSPVVMPMTQWSKDAPVAATLAAILGVVWWYPVFSTTDGPSHVYNAEIIRQYFMGHGPQLRYFEVVVLPLPNWVSHALLACLLAWFTPATAERVVASAYFIGWAAAIRFYLRSTGAWTSSARVLGMIVAVNLPLMMGFYNFCVGVIGYLVVLGSAWRGQPRTWGQTFILGIIIVATYFCNPLPFVASLLAMSWLRVVGPVERARAGLDKMAAAALPGLVLFVWYSLYTPGPERTAMISPRLPPSLGGAFNWSSLECLWYAASGQRMIAFAALAAWLALLASGAWSRESGRSRGTGKEWFAIALLAVCPIALSVLVPLRYDELFLATRLSFLGLVTGLGAFSTTQSPTLRRLSGVFVGALAVATILMLVDYLRQSNDERAAHLAAQKCIGEGWLLTPIVNWRPAFRVDSMSHAEGYLAAAMNQVDFGNYEAPLTYFPVDFRAGVELPPKIYGKPLETADYVEVARKVDAVLVWGRTPMALTTSGAFREVFASGSATVYFSNFRRPAPTESPCSSGGAS